MTDIMLAEVAELTARANAWCNFAIVCGWIGFGLSMICAVWLVMKVRKENKDV